MRVLVWNLRWARPDSPRGRKITKQIEEIDPDIAVLTETDGDFFGAGHTVLGTQDWGYEAPASARKVLLWSKAPWSEVDRLGSPLLPGGRYVSGVTSTGAGVIRCVGVCIPWRDAHVRTGRRDRARWEDHLTFLRTLEKLMLVHEHPCILAGDWNQRIPRKYQPKRVKSALDAAILEGFRVHTAGVIRGLDAQLIDHVATTRDVSAHSITGISKFGPEGAELSDHHGIVVDLRVTS